MALTTVSTLALSLQAHALNLNDPAADAAGGIANYWDRGNTLPNVVSLFMQSDGSYCTGSLINSRMVLTASHCMVDEDTNQIASHLPGSQIRFSSDAFQAGPNDRGISGILAHPGYSTTTFGVHDIGLVSLSRPVTNVTPVTLIAPGDPLPPVGSLVIMSGYGRSGTGTDPESIDDSKRRIGATNIGAYAPASPGAPQSIRAQFRNPASPSSPDAFNLSGMGVPVPSLQAQPGRGDSGGPLFLVTDKGLVQIGTVIGGGPDGYSGIDNWTPVQDYLTWIYANNPLRSTSANPGTFNWSNPAAWADTLGRSEVPNNSDGGFAGYGQLGRYYEVSLKAASAMTADMDATVDSLSIAHPQASLNIPSARTLTTLLDTQVSNGALQVDGRINVQNLVLLGGALSGSGTVAASGGLVNAAGTVSPGQAGSLGTLTVSGNYQQLSNGTLAIRVIGGNADRLAVTGSASLDGTLALTGAPTAINTSQSYTVLTAGQGVSGRFANVSSNLLFLDPALAYRSDLVSVSFVRNNRAFDQVATDANDDAVADALKSLTPSNRIYQAIVASTSATDVRRALDLLSGEGHATAVTSAYGQGQLVQSSLLARLRQPLIGPALPRLAQGAGQGAGPGAFAAAYAADRPGAPVPPVAVAAAAPAAYALWGEGFGAWGRTRSDGNAASLATATGGFVLGADALLADGLRLGLAGGYASTAFDVDARLSSGSSEGVFGAVYGAGQWGALAVRLGGVATRHDFALTRSVSFPGFADALRASYGGTSLQGFGEVGYRLGLGALALEPFAGAALLRLDSDGFQERGGAAALVGFGRRFALGTTTLGVRAEARLGAELPVLVRGLLGWRHAYGDVAPEARLGLAGAGVPFTVAGAPVDRDALVAEAGLDWQAAAAVTLGVAYAGQIGTRAQEHALKGNLTWRF
ncbi:autotransporter domain-containing protein [Microvirga thermotolerans]|uniref:autotransporter family protein n=1 Tax=Microvirga thermotolerans TaxID=2651334 RepID=UPI001883DC16|nr:autotransporter domain-containing protein [Microvirga thermotolerans]